MSLQHEIFGKHAWFPYSYHALVILYYIGGHLYFRLDIILLKGLSKHTLNTYFSGMKIDPKYTFLHAFFSICPSCPFQNLSVWPIAHPFPILHVFAPLNDVCAYIAWSRKTTLITWISFMRMISNFKYKCPPVSIVQIGNWLTLSINTHEALTTDMCTQCVWFHVESHHGSTARLGDCNHLEHCYYSTSSMLDEFTFWPCLETL